MFSSVTIIKFNVATNVVAVYVAMLSLFFSAGKVVIDSLLIL